MILLFNKPNKYCFDFFVSIEKQESGEKRNEASKSLDVKQLNHNKLKEEKETRTQRSKKINITKNTRNSKTGLRNQKSETFSKKKEISKNPKTDNVSKSRKVCLKKKNVRMINDHLLKASKTDSVELPNVKNDSGIHIKDSEKGMNEIYHEISKYN